MPEKPIPMYQYEVRAILDGRMSQFRRVIKPQPEKSIQSDRVMRYPSAFWVDGKKWIKPLYDTDDILWVRETWSTMDDLPYDNYVYRTDYGTTEDDSFPPSMFKWRPSIHMPRSAARLFLLVKSVRVERLQDISVQDAKDEGIKMHANGCKDGLAYGCYNGDSCVNNTCKQPIEYFQEIWNSIYKNWAENPWVWVIEFERVTP